MKRLFLLLILFILFVKIHSCDCEEWDDGGSCEQCEKGFYCNGTNKIICSLGNYCDQNDICTPIPCSLGSYCPIGTDNEDPDCEHTFYCPTPSFQILCPGGSYCLGMPTATAISGSCQQGYYCPAGSDSPTHNLCSLGYYCPIGSASQIECGLGYYCPNPETQIACSSGSYCPPRTVSENPDCGLGYYCPNPETQIACSSGSYCPPRTVSENPDCGLGYYCPNSTIQIKCKEYMICLGTRLIAPGKYDMIIAYGCGAIIIIACVVMCLICTFLGYIMYIIYEKRKNSKISPFEKGIR